MVYSDTTNKNGIVQLCESLCKLGDSGITGDTTLFKQFTGYLNQAYKKVAIAILRVDRNWNWDDSNWSDYPVATVNLVSGQREYALPTSTAGGNASNLWQVDLIEIMDTSGVYHPIVPMEYGELETTATGMPTKYTLSGKNIRLEAIPLTGYVTTTAGMRVRFKRSVSEFTTASTTAQPGFIDTYHDLLAYDASATYLIPINTQLALTYSQIFENRLKLLQTDWMNRTDDRTGFKAKVRNYE